MPFLLHKLKHNIIIDLKVRGSDKKAINRIKKAQSKVEKLQK